MSGNSVCSVARRHGLSPQQLFGWQRQLREAAGGHSEADKASPHRRLTQLAVHRPPDLRSRVNRTEHPTPELPYGSWCLDHRASGHAIDLHAPFFRPGSVLMGSDDGGIDDQVFEVRIIGHCLKDAAPDAFGTPSTEATEYAVPVPERLWKITPGSPYARSKAHLPQTSDCRDRPNPSGQAGQ